MEARVRRLNLDGSTHSETALAHAQQVGVETRGRLFEIT